MSLFVDISQRPLFLKKLNSHCCWGYSLNLFPRKLWFVKRYGMFQKNGGVKLSPQGSSSAAAVHIDRCSLLYEAKCFDEMELDALPYVRSLREFRKEELSGRTVMVRFDSNILLGEKQDKEASVFTIALSTIKYLCEAGAKVILVSGWTVKTNSNLLTVESISEHLSSVLKLRVVPRKSMSRPEQPMMEDSQKDVIYLLENLSQIKEEFANCSRFSEELSSGVDIFVNDAFFQSHKVLASTVGVASFCYASVAGFHFEAGLHQLKKAFRTKKYPYVAVVGGGNLIKKVEALRYLVANCDGLVFVGKMAFQIMHALRLPVPKKLVEPGACEEALQIIQFAKSRSTQILFPKDFWCINDHLQKQLELFPSDCILDGWLPVALGPNSIDEITSLLSRSEKILWIGSVKFGLSNEDSCTASILAKTLDKVQRDCDITVVGNMACKATMEYSTSVSTCNMIENASVVWEFLKGRKLHGVLALDRGYPFPIDWHGVYTNPAQPLLVDIGSGNGLFIFGMSRMRKDMNFLGLELNAKLVKRCLDSIRHHDTKSRYFIATNATSTFRSIVSDYPGKLVLVSIQCPNPDFRKPQNRWRMLQRSLVEAIVDLLAIGGKVFLQSDIKAVALTMKEQFVKYGKGMLDISHHQPENTISEEEWLKENPFGVQSDWERHVINRGAPMYRIMLLKLRSN